MAATIPVKSELWAAIPSEVLTSRLVAPILARNHTLAQFGKSLDLGVCLLLERCGDVHGDVFLLELPEGSLEVGPLDEVV